MDTYIVLSLFDVSKMSNIQSCSPNSVLSLASVTLLIFSYFPAHPISFEVCFSSILTLRIRVPHPYLSSITSPVLPE